MKLKAFEVQMYRCILDSKRVDLSELTVLVGKNESGKTSLLRALHKFNPFRPEPYVINREWPRGHRRQQDEKQVVCTTWFDLSDTEVEELGALADDDFTVRTVRVSKDYGGRF